MADLNRVNCVNGMFRLWLVIDSDNKPPEISSIPRTIGIRNLKLCVEYEYEYGVMRNQILQMARRQLGIACHILSLELLDCE